ncbi:hypothetical protein AeRB84_007722, partial [Aphanomyces euteiches]
MATDQDKTFYTALASPSGNAQPRDFESVVQIEIPPIVPPADEKWIEVPVLPQFTYQDAQAMEWDYANVTKQTLRQSFRNHAGSKTSQLSYRPSSEFGDPDRETKEELGVLLDPFYDVTTGRLRRMFKHFTPYGKEEVTYDEFQNGLLALGISVPSSMSFREFVRKVDTNGDGVISLDEFVKVVQMIKLAHLFRPEHNQVDKHILRVVDYSPTNMHAVAPVTKLQSFMFSAKPTWAKVRWVHLAGFHKLDDLNMRRLAIKYQLHPLAVEDCLNQNDKIRCKYEHYEDHAFLVVPVIRALSLEKRSHIEDYIAAYRQDVFNKRQALMKDGIIEPPSVESKDSLTAKLNELKIITQVPDQLCVFVNLTTNNVLSVQADVDNDTSAFMLWDALFDHNMEKSYSKVRSHDAPFLVVSILNAVVDEILPLVEVFEAKFELQGQLLRLEGIKFDTMRFALAKKQLRALEKIVRPLLDLVQDHL